MNKAIKEKADDEDLKKRLCQLYQRAFGKNTAKPVDGIQLIQLEFNGLRIKRQADLKKIDGQPNQHNSEHNGKSGLGEDNGNADKDAQNILRIHDLIQIAEHIGCVAGNGKINIIPKEFQRKEANEEHERRVQLLTASDLPFLSGIGALLCRWFFRLFPAGETLEVKGK